MLCKIERDYLYLVFLYANRVKNNGFFQQRFHPSAQVPSKIKICSLWRLRLNNSKVLFRREAESVLARKTSLGQVGRHYRFEKTGLIGPTGDKTSLWRTLDTFRTGGFLCENVGTTNFLKNVFRQMKTSRKSAMGWRRARTESLKEQPIKMASVSRLSRSLSPRAKYGRFQRKNGRSTRKN